MGIAKGQAGQRLLRVSCLQISRDAWSLPVPSFGIPFAAPEYMTELVESSLRLSIFQLSSCRLLVIRVFVDQASFFPPTKLNGRKK
jgi:hypothetical protein